MYSIANWYIETRRIILIRQQRNVRANLKNKMAQMPTDLSAKYSFKFSFYPIKIYF